MVQVGLAMVRCTNAAEHRSVERREGMFLDRGYLLFDRYTLKAYNFYLFPENEMDAFDFRSKVSPLLEYSLVFVLVSRL